MPVLLCLFILLVASARGAESDGFIPLFNGRDLTGWRNVNCAPETWSVRDGTIHCTGIPTGALRTERQYENFILELEWRHLSSGGNSGIFIWASPLAAPGVPFLRCIEVQVLDHGYNAPGKNERYTTHGDVFPIHGTTMEPFGRHNGERSFPSEERSKGSPEWNHYRIVATNGVLRLHVNGKEVSGGQNCNYRKGYLGLESEGAPVEFRNLRIQELPSSGAPVELSAPMNLGWRTLFTGTDLRRWKTNASVLARWEVKGERIHLRENAGDNRATLWSEEEFGDVEFVLDCRRAKAAVGKETGMTSVLVRGHDDKGVEVNLSGLTPGEYQRFVITVKGQEVKVTRNDKPQPALTLPSDAPTRGSFGIVDNGAAMEFLNLYVRDL